MAQNAPTPAPQQGAGNPAPQQQGQSSPTPQQTAGTPQIKAQQIRDWASL